MQIKVTTIYVDDQDKALGFYTGVLGMAKKADFGNGAYRWLTVSFADDPNGVELQLAADTDPVGKAYQQGLFGQGQPGIMFFTNDIKAERDRISGRGGKFKMEPTDVTGSTIAQIEDGCGNIVQITQLKW
jgi:predicted enzyme related to lactoylglutathione lyase